MILSFLATQKDLDMERAGIFGQGSGGAIAALAASVDTRLKAVDLVDPWGDWPAWLAETSIVPAGERAGYLKGNFLDSLTGLEPMKVLPLLAGRVRLQQTAFDPVTPAAAQKALAARLPAGAPHVIYASEDEYVEKAAAKARILEWLTEQLTARR